MCTTCGCGSKVKKNKCEKCGYEEEAFEVCPKCES